MLIMSAMPEAAAAIDTEIMVAGGDKIEEEQAIR